jgi:hypothetical protein
MNFCKLNIFKLPKLGVAEQKGAKGTLLKIDTFPSMIPASEWPSQCPKCKPPNVQLSLPLVSPPHDSNDTIRLLWPGKLSSSSPVTKFFLFYPRAGHFRVSSRGEESQAHPI